MPDTSYHMTGEEFRKAGYAAIDWIVDYMRTVEDLPVLSQVRPGEIRAKMPARPPAEGEPFEAILRDMNEIVLPGLTHWQNPNFFGFFPCNTSGPSILGELLSAGLGVQGMLWTTSPACTEIETHVLDWLVDMLALPEQFRSRGRGGGVIADSASGAGLCALLAARERATNFFGNERGTFGRLTAYISTQTHSSIEKDVKIAGLGRANLRLIEVDSTFAMRPEALEAAIERDLAAGCTPCFTCATVGTTSSNAIDPVRRIGEICRRHNIWLHVDGAMSGTAAVCPEFRWIHDGLELADSYCFNPHKWMFTNFDCTCFFVADRAALTQALSILPEYLKNQASTAGEVIDYRDWQVSLGRRFRALKLWFVIRHYGIEGLQHHIRRHVELAQQFRRWVEADRRFELAAPAPLNLVTFRRLGGDEVNQKILDTVNRSGKALLTHTRLDGKLTVRMSIGQTHTQRRHVENAWRMVCAAADPVARNE